MARQRSHSIEFKRQVAQEFIAGESLYVLSKRHDISRQLVRVWVQKYEAGAKARRSAYDPQPTSGGLKSRSAVGLPQCYRPVRSTGEFAGETPRFHHAARRCGCRVAARSAGAIF